MVKESITTSCSSVIGNEGGDSGQTEDENERQERRRETNQRVVRFERNARCHRMLGIHEFTPQERSSYWYCRREFQSMRAEGTELVHQSFARNTDMDLLIDNMVNLDKETEENCCLRGLENRGDESWQLSRLSAITSVLAEQGYQDTVSFSKNEEKIAKIYHNKTKSAIAEARRRGIQDEIEVYGRRQKEHHDLFTRRKRPIGTNRSVGMRGFSKKRLVRFLKRTITPSSLAQ